MLRGSQELDLAKASQFLRRIKAVTSLAANRREKPHAFPVSEGRRADGKNLRRLANSVVDRFIVDVAHN